MYYMHYGYYDFKHLVKLPTADRCGVLFFLSQIHSLCFPLQDHHTLFLIHGRVVARSIGTYNIIPRRVELKLASSSPRCIQALIAPIISEGRNRTAE